MENPQDEYTVRTPSLAYQNLASDWAMIECVRGGTRAMREAGESYLPREQSEDDEAYLKRLNRATLSPIYTRLVRVFSSMILRKPIKILNTEGMADNDFQIVYEQLMSDIDGRGSNLELFAFEVLKESIHGGYCGIEVIYPKIDGFSTRAEEIESGVRPFWSLYTSQNILGDKVKNNIRENVRLLQLVTEDVGEWGEELIEQVLVYKIEDGIKYSQLYRLVKNEDGKEKWELYEEHILDIPNIKNELPFVFVFSDKRLIQAQPPMIEVAYLNVRHWQVTADLENSLHVAAVPRMFIFGASDDDIQATGTLSGNMAIAIPDPQARVDWSAPNTQAFEPCSDRLKDLQHNMLELGLSTMTSQKNVGESAESKRLDRAQSDSQLAVLSQNLQNALYQALRIHVAYLGLDPETTPTIQVNRDFDGLPISPQMVNALLAILNAGKLSTETFLWLLQYGEILPDDLNLKDEIERIQTEFRNQMESPQVPNGILGGELEVIEP
jgi:hypothetical protein